MFFSRWVQQSQWRNQWSDGGEWRTAKPANGRHCGTGQREMVVGLLSGILFLPSLRENPNNMSLTHQRQESLIQQFSSVQISGDELSHLSQIHHEQYFSTKEILLCRVAGIFWVDTSEWF